MNPYRHQPRRETGSKILLAIFLPLALASIGLEIYAWHVIATVGVDHAPWWVLFLAFSSKR